MNTGQRSRRNLPALMVYVGNVKEYSIEYHPKDWWLNTLIKCFIFSKTGQSNGFKSVTDFEREGLNFLEDAIELDQATLDDFIEIFSHTRMADGKRLDQIDSPYMCS